MFISNMSTFSDFHSTQYPLAMPHIWSLTTILFLLIPVERLVSRVESQQVGTGSLPSGPDQVGGKVEHARKLLRGAGGGGEGSWATLEGSDWVERGEVSLNWRERMEGVGGGG